MESFHARVCMNFTSFTTIHIIPNDIWVETNLSSQNDINVKHHEKRLHISFHEASKINSWQRYPRSETSVKRKMEVLRITYNASVVTQEPSSLQRWSSILSAKV